MQAFDSSKETFVQEVYIKFVNRSTRYLPESGRQNAKRIFHRTPGTGQPVVEDPLLASHLPDGSGGARDFGQRGRKWSAGALRRRKYTEPQHDLSHGFNFQTFHLVFPTW